MRVGFVGVDSEAGTKPEDAGFGNGHEVSGWLPSRFGKGRGQCARKAIMRDSEGFRGKEVTGLFYEGEKQGCHLRAIC